MVNAASAGLVAALVGRALRSVEKCDYTWVFAFDSGVAISSDADWRLVMDGRVRASSHDHGHVFGLPAPFDAVEKLQSSLVGCAVESAAIVADTGDLRLEFGRSVRLELLQLSTGYESWGLSTPQGRIICVGGGELVHFPQE